MSKKLDTAIRSRLEARRGEWPDIVKQTGVSHSWLSKFARGLIPNPGIRTLEKLDAALPKPRRTTTPAKSEAAHG